MEYKLRNNLKIIRAQYGVTSAAFAAALGIKNNTYSQWETNKSNPNLLQAYIIAHKLGKNITEIWELNL